MLNVRLSSVCQRVKCETVSVSPFTVNADSVMGKMCPVDKITLNKWCVINV